MALIKGKQLSNNTIALTKLATQAEAEILVADASGQLQAVSLGTDATIAASGALTIASNAINSDKISDGSVIFAKVSNTAISSDLSVSATATQLARADAAKAYADARYTAATTYADNVANGLDVKDSVRVASAGSNITLATDVENGDTFDGVQLATGDRILLKDQTTATENGIYVVAASGAPSRAADADQGNLTGGCFFFVEEGTNADNGFVCTNNGTPTLGTDNIVFSQFSGSGTITAGSGLTKTGNQLDVNVDNSTIEISSDALQLKDAGIISAKLANQSVKNVHLATEIAGTGIAGANGTALSVDLNQLGTATSDPAADSIVFIDATDSSTKKETLTQFVSKISGSGVTTSNSQITVKHMTTNDQFETATATTADGNTTGVTIAAAPEGMVQIFVNGILQELGQGVKTKDCYFSSDGGTTARTISTITTGDTLYWNGSVAGYQLDATDKITMVYEG